MTKVENVTLSVIFLYLSAIIVLVIGWVMNIVKLVSCDFIVSTEGVLRVVGIFVAPMGGILGYFGHF